MSSTKLALLGTPEVTGDISMPGVLIQAWPDFPQELTADQLELVEFAVPPYMGDARGLKQLGQMPRLAVCQLLTIGFDEVLPLLSETVTVCNARGVHEDSTAELAVGLILASIKGFRGDIARANQGEWFHFRRGTLQGANVVILGAGGVAQAIKTRLRPFDVQITLVARSARGEVKDMASIEKLLSKADVLIIALPLNHETLGLVDAAVLAALPDGALVVNVARGAVMSTEALSAEARSRRLNFALDVIDPEPLPPSHPLWSLENVLITPHVGGNTDAFPLRARGLVRRQLEKYLVGAPLENVVRAGT